MPVPTPTPYAIATRTVPTFYFIGVTTKKSSIMKVFPLWTQELGRPEVVIEGVDLQLHDARDAYRQVTAQIKYDPLSLGAASGSLSDRGWQPRSPATRLALPVYYPVIASHLH